MLFVECDNDLLVSHFNAFLSHLWSSFVFLSLAIIFLGSAVLLASWSLGVVGYAFFYGVLKRVFIMHGSRAIWVSSFSLKSVLLKFESWSLVYLEVDSLLSSFVGVTKGTKLAGVVCLNSFADKSISWIGGRRCCKLRRLLSSSISFFIRFSSNSRINNFLGYHCFYNIWLSFTYLVMFLLLLTSFLPSSLLVVLHFFFLYSLSVVPCSVTDFAWDKLHSFLCSWLLCSPSIVFHGSNRQTIWMVCGTVISLKLFTIRPNSPNNNIWQLQWWCHRELCFCGVSWQI